MTSDCTSPVAICPFDEHVRIGASETGSKSYGDVLVTKDRLYLHDIAPAAFEKQADSLNLDIVSVPASQVE